MSLEWRTFLQNNVWYLMAQSDEARWCMMGIAGNVVRTKQTQDRRYAETAYNEASIGGLARDAFCSLQVAPFTNMD